MKTLLELFEEKRGVLDNGAYVRSKAPEVFRGSALVLRDELAPTPRVAGALVGIAFYSPSDLKIVDALVRRSQDRKDSNPASIEVFDILICKSTQDLERILPGITPLYGTPIVGIWENSELVEKGSGAEGRRIICQYYGIE